MFKQLMSSHSLHRKLRTKEIATAAMLIATVVRDSKFVRKSVGKGRKHFDVCSLHMPINTIVIYLSIGRRIGRRGGVTTGKGITRRRKN